ncbi:MAG TPA: hypothetical protein PKZ72_04530, partial [Saprospiraceae bacterium]|nr:hypothetical protein [Saprospiraceae bacterium]
MKAEDKNVMVDALIEQVDTVAEAMKNIAKIDEVDIATSPRELVWSDGKVKLYHFLSDTPKVAKTPVMISYALVNRWEMMDLQPDRSFVRKMLSLGMDVYVIDWGYPT